MNQEFETFRRATGELIGFGTVGALLDSAYEVLIELDQTMAADLDVLNRLVIVRFADAEELLFSIGKKEE